MQGFLNDHWPQIADKAYASEHSQTTAVFFQCVLQIAKMAKNIIKVIKVIWNELLPTRSSLKEIM